MRNHCYVRLAAKAQLAARTILVCAIAISGCQKQPAATDPAGGGTNQTTEAISPINDTQQNRFADEKRYYRSQDKFLPADFPKMVKAWREGDDATVGKMIDDSMPGSPQFRKELLDNRNENWAKKIKEYIKGDKDIMVIVGAAHLVGEKGLIELLKVSGLRVERWSEKKDKEKKPSNKKSRFIPI